MTRILHLLTALIAATLAACSPAADSPAPGTGGASRPPPSQHDVAEIELDIGYEVLGNPVVGQPVAIGLRLVAKQQPGPIILSYRPGDASSMYFPESQASEVELVPAPDQQVRIRQVTVVPQRAGRLYLNVSAEMGAAHGSFIKSMAVPILVNAAPESSRPAAATEDDKEQQPAAPPEDEPGR